MYLRNKKTGEVVDWSFVGPTAIKEYKGEDVLLERERYESIEEFISEWEDYEPKEPLIKDEKIKKAVRAWAEANDFTNEIEVRSLDAGTRFSEGHWSIEFIGYFIYDLKIGSTYTIAELCGEEEE